MLSYILGGVLLDHALERGSVLSAMVFVVVVGVPTRMLEDVVMAVVVNRVKVSNLHESKSLSKS